MNKKRERERRGVGLGGRHLAEQRNNQIIDGVVSGGGAMEERSDLGGTCGMTPCHRSSRRIDQQIIKEKIRRDLKWPPNMLIHTTTNQIQPGGMGEGYKRTHDRRGAQGGCNVIVLDAIELS